MGDDYWKDNSGNLHKTPQTKWRLDFRCREHKALRAYVMQRDGFKCQRCGVQSDPIEGLYDGSRAPRIDGGEKYLVVDHIWSRCCGQDGYSHHPNNLQVLCSSCNTWKRNMVDIKNSEGGEDA